MYRRPELEEYQGDWTEAERDLAINFFKFLTWYHDDFISPLIPTDKPIQEKELEKVSKEVDPYKKQPIPI